MIPHGHLLELVGSMFLQGEAHMSSGSLCVHASMKVHVRLVHVDKSLAVCKSGRKPWPKSVMLAL